MTARDFAYWLQGYFELNAAADRETSSAGDRRVTRPIPAEVVRVIENHLALVFKHDIDAPDPTGVLQATHDGTTAPVRPGPGGGSTGTLYRCGRMP